MISFALIQRFAFAGVLVIASGACSAAPAPATFTLAPPTATATTTTPSITPSSTSTAAPSPTALLTAAPTSSGGCVAWSCTSASVISAFTDQFALTFGPSRSFTGGHASEWFDSNSSVDVLGNEGDDRLVAVVVANVSRGATLPDQMIYALEFLEPDAASAAAWVQGEYTADFDWLDANYPACFVTVPGQTGGCPAPLDTTSKVFGSTLVIVDSAWISADTAGAEFDNGVVDVTFRAAP